ncbi:hypothetical protein [Shinella zoogloeoides]|uniref:hypothetical protein n=1 Tax=Shinella zoogloeoides TaxID=352475 RepID=UPI00299DC5AE|nr:hypothetical protein [Shinella zoogloeoides]WPE19971.1 hypothetical protein ShzoTeo12_11510 [Shinella zoogloeoides]
MTTPYTTGTISLTNGSAVIMGTGTAWQIALIKGGIVYPEAAGNGLPIATVDSDTQITAAVDWTGLTGTYSYALVRDTAYDAQIAQNAEALARLLAGLEAGTIWKYDMSGDTAGRDIYDAKPKGFSYLDVSQVPAQLWVKASNTEGDWAGPHSYGQGAKGEPGPVGAAANVVFEEPETGLPGTDVEMDVTGAGTTGDPYRVTFTIPRGNPGEDGMGTGDVVGPAGASDGHLVVFDGATGKVLKDGGAPFSGAYVDLSGKPALGSAAAMDVGTTAGAVAAGDDSRLVNAVSREGDTALKGYSATGKDLGTLSGSVTLTFASGNIQHGANGGAVTINAPTAAGVYTIIVEIVNGASAGAVTLAGFTKVDGDAFTTTNGHKFHLHIAKTNSAVTATVKALQ